MAQHSLHKLSTLQTAKLRKAGRHSDGGGLYLSIDKTGRRRWVFMYVRNGKRVELGLGSGRDLPLASARAKAAAFRTMRAEGHDPKAQRVRKKVIPTFGEAADAYVEAMTPSWRNRKHADQWKMTLKRYAEPIRERLVSDVDIDDVLRVLRPVWSRTPETAERLRGRIEAVLNAASAKGHRTGENPAAWRGRLDQLLPKRQRLSRGHHTALPFAAAPAFMAGLRAREAAAARALEFTILTAARSGEALGVRWEEIDIDRQLWIVPAERMKAAREHRVPLSARAVAIITEMAESGTTGLIFPGPNPGTALSSMAMAMLLRRMKTGVTVHGFRSTFRDWASEATSFPHEVCEMALAHTIGNKAEAAYRRGDLFDKRRALMEEWAAYCAAPQTTNSASLRPSEVA